LKLRFFKGYDIRLSNLRLGAVELAVRAQKLEQNLVTKVRMNMKALLLISLILSSFSCVADSLIDAKIGTWCESNDNGKSCLGYETFYKDGTVKAKGEVIQFGFGYEMEGLWTQTNNKSCIMPLKVYEYDLITKQPQVPAHSKPFCSTVISIGDKEYIYKNAAGNIFKMYKVIKPPE